MTVANRAVCLPDKTDTASSVWVDTAYRSKKNEKKTAKGRAGLEGSFPHAARQADARTKAARPLVSIGASLSNLAHGHLFAHENKTGGCNFGDNQVARAV